MVADFAFISGIFETPLIQANLIQVGVIHDMVMGELNQMPPNFAPDQVNGSRGALHAANSPVGAPKPPAPRQQLVATNESPVPTRTMNRAVPYQSKPNFPTPGGMG